MQTQTPADADAQITPETLLLAVLRHVWAEADHSTPILDNAEALFIAATGQKPPALNDAQFELAVAYARAGILAGMVHARQQQGQADEGTRVIGFGFVPEGGDE